MFADYDMPGSEPSGAPASFATARAPESEVRALAESSPGVDSQTPSPESDPSPAANETSTVSGLANPSDGGSSGNSAPLSSQAPATETPAATDESAGTPSSEELNQLMDQYAAPQQAPTEGEIVQGRVV